VEQIREVMPIWRDFPDLAQLGCEYFLLAIGRLP
jgi:hypothetical protein